LLRPGTTAWRSRFRTRILAAVDRWFFRGSLERENAMGRLLVAAIRNTYARSRTMPREVAGILEQRLARDRLSARELDVLRVAGRA
jgi:DNA-binding NarL/FixJ family response regulator